MKYSLSILAALSASLLSLSASKKHIIIDVLDDRNDTSLTTLPDASLNTGVSAYVRGALSMNDGGGGHFISDGSEWIEQSKLNVIYQRATDGTGGNITVFNPSPNMAVTGSVDLVEWGVIPNVTWVQNGDGSSTATIPALPALQPKGFFRVEEVERNNEALIVFLEGQSNAEGFGRKAEYEIDDLPLGNMYQLSYGNPRSNYEEGRQYFYKTIRAWMPLQNRRSYDSSPNAGLNSVSWGFYLAKNIAKANPNKDVVIVKNTWGGTGFGFNDGAWSTTTAGYMRSSGVVLLSETVDQLKEKYTSVDIAVHAWHQGEADSNFGRSSVHQVNLVDFARERRKLFADLGLNSPPFICGTMLSSWISSQDVLTGGEASVVDSVHRNIGNLVPNAGFADLSGLNSPQDSVHFGADDLQIAGDLYYNAYQSLDKTIETSNPFLELRIEGDELVIASEEPKHIGFGGANARNGQAYFNRDSSYSFGVQSPLSELRWTKLCHIFLGTNVGGSFNLISGDALSGGQGAPFYISNGSLRVSDNDLSPFDYISVPITSLNYGDWVTLAVTYDGSTLRLFDENGLLGSATADLVSPENTSVSFGSFNRGNQYVGKAKYFAVYDEALFHSEIIQIHDHLLDNETVELNRGLRAEYLFDGGFADSSNNNDATIFTGTPTTTATELVLDGTSSLNTGIKENEIMTRYVRFRASATNPTGQGMNLVTPNIGNNTTTRGLPFWIEPTKDTIEAGKNSIWSPNPEASYNQVTNFYDGNWHKAAMSIRCIDDDVWVTLAINGDIIATLPVTRNPATQGLTNEDLLIGSFGASNFLYGEIDEVRLYDRPLNDTEMKTLTTP